MPSSSLFTTSQLCTIASCAALSFTLAAAPGTASDRLCVDQFGYLPDAAKVAVLSDPQTGYNQAASYTPGGTCEVRMWPSNTVVFTGTPASWKSGTTHAQSGDRVWWFDFSALTKWGTYYVYDPTNDLRSAVFRVGDDVYRPALREATRVFFYQRSGCAKAAPYTDPRWADGASHLGLGQDTQCRLVTATNNASTARNLSGGWYDAGDYNKYVNFTRSPVSDLVFAYLQQPAVWTDDFGLPESGNGVPDLLDETKWELDWLLRMQSPDGSVLSKVSVLGFAAASPPSADTAPRYYSAASTSATLTAAANFAQSAIAFAHAGQTAYAAQLRAAGVAAWNWAEAHPSVIDSNTGFSSANPEVSTYERSMLKLCTAIYLYATEGSATYRTYVESNYLNAQLMAWYYWYAFEAPLQDALLYYSSLPGVTASVASEIRSRKNSSMGGSEFMGAITNKTDAYRAFMKDEDYTWGSNRNKCQVGLIFHQHAIYNVNPAQTAACRTAAGDFVHYMHGVNPQGMVYLTNVYAIGARKCANEMYHAWFGHGTIYDNAQTSPSGPAPGYVPGGPNPHWSPDSSYSGPTLSPPTGQPVLKSYRDWNTSWPENSWEVTEPGIYYQAAYLHLLAGVVRPLQYGAWVAGHGLTGADAAESADPDRDGVPNSSEYLLGGNPSIPDPVSLIPSISANELKVTFNRRPASDATLRLQSSSTLAPGSWQTIAQSPPGLSLMGNPQISETITAGGFAVTLKLTLPSPTAQLFLRTTVEN